MKVFFHLVLLAVGIVLSVSNGTLNLFLSNELLRYSYRVANRNVLVMAEEMALTSFIPSFTSNWKQ